MKKYISIIYVILIIPFQLSANNLEFDSLLQSTKNKQQFDSLIKYLFLNKDTTKEKENLSKIFELAEKLNYPNGLFYVNDGMGVLNRNLSDYSKALYYHRKALAIAEKTGNIYFQVQALNNIGVVYRRIDDNSKALFFHIKALKLAEEIKDVKNICIAYNSIGNIYFSLAKYNEAIMYFEKALPLEKKRGNLLGVSINLDNIGSVYEALGNNDKALNNYKNSLYYDLAIKNKAGEGICYNAIGNIYLKKKLYKLAIFYFNKSLEISRGTGDLIYVASSYISIANTYLQVKDYGRAIEAFQKGLEIAVKIGSKSQISIAYDGLSQCYQGKSDFNKALKYYQESVIYNDSILNEQNLQQIAHLEAEYDKEKKSQQIKLLEKDKRAAILYKLITTILFVAFFISVIIGIVVIRQRRRIITQELNIKEQKIIDLEKERLLVATKSVLKGEEIERGRLARELHDGLGGLLSGIKLSFNNIKENILVSPEHEGNFSKTLNLIDTSIKELRYIAHNLMPQALVKYGLKDALSDFCNNLSSNRSINILFHYYGNEKRLSSSFEISIYRIVQELINNAIKHSKAKEIIVQLILDDNRLNISVQDNGIGFDISLIKTVKSAGLANIYARVESNEGLIDIYSKPGEGTEITIDFPLKEENENKKTSEV
jgi:signal transduction histidine kinase